MHGRAHLPAVAAALISQVQPGPTVFAFESERDACLYATYVAHTSRDGYAPSVHLTSSADAVAYAEKTGLEFFIIGRGSTDFLGVEPSKFVRCFGH